MALVALELPVWVLPSLSASMIITPPLPKPLTRVPLLSILARATYYQATIAEVAALEEICAQVRALHITSFGDMPLIVLSRGLPNPSPLLSDIENQQVWEIMQEWQSELVGLSSESKQIIAEQSGHHIQLDQPELVIEAVREMVNTNRE